MPTVPVLGGQDQATLELSAVFGGPVRVPLVHQAVVRELAARRTGTHDTRGRSEVSGGGKKPWKQKGTGRARQGSIRATQWKGGGKPFGPTPRSYGKRMPSAMRHAALREAVASRIAAGGLVVVDRLGLDEARTKVLADRLRALGIEPRPTLLMLAERSAAVERAARNIPWLDVETPGHVSVYQIMRNERVVCERAAIAALEEALRS
jgi:large subunit ribosomal protein L4